MSRRVVIAGVTMVAWTAVAVFGFLQNSPEPPYSPSELQNGFSLSELLIDPAQAWAFILAGLVRDAAPVTYGELLELARRLEGRMLDTVTGKRFTVGIYRDCPFFTPASSGYGQSDGRKAAERFLERYNESGSLRPGDYADVTRNASYFIGMLLRQQDE